ncbi:glycoside hydrolase family 43 protein [Zasmidium cellare ATCC 36951]|uniref:Glycoside hydrolase family 43 protein n=1 Tax=Zasmidium cellare ATCC 36951 TaxID=1080233 RepID=A0A6A6CF70_ZASCE|nr:glycoside hydrolase family 43 protein [Zasmidium cellare ATCC 36951]KAF2165293.1 glycoside hydrolase family 43 protein [Zasmidium cellare ATCC 36951]
MFSVGLPLTLFLAGGLLCLASTTSLPERSIVKRAPSGPKLFGDDFPDPAVINYANTWYSFATQKAYSAIRTQVASSSDFNTWQLVNNSVGSQHDAMPNLASWVYSPNPNVWAPDVNLLSSGSFIMYYCATTSQSTSHHCVGAAHSSNIVGPYTADSSPLICNLTAGGDIDPSGYSENGQQYLLWKVDGNSLGNSGLCGNDNGQYSTRIRIQTVGSGGVTLQGGITDLLDNCDYLKNCASGTTDNGIVEAPSLAKVGSTYVLFFSSGCYATSNYRVNYATSSSLLGPYTRHSGSLFQNGTYGLNSPGGASIARDGQHLVFHANYGSGRALYTDVISVSGTTVSG